MFRSFRFRLAVISALISGLVVIAFGASAWWSLSRSSVQALDADLRHFGFRVALRTGRSVDAQRLEASLTELLGVDKAANRFFTLLSSDQELLFASQGWPSSLDAKAYPPSAKPLEPQPEDHYRRPTDSRSEPRIVIEPRFHTVEVKGTRYRIGVFANPDVVLVLGANFSEHARVMHQLRRAFLLALPGAVLVVAFGAAFVSWRALRPVETLSRDMENISARELHHRLDLDRADREFEGIIRSYNAMLERLERSFHQARRFSADASHELKTPLAIMQGVLERALKQCEGHPAALDALMEVLEQSGRQRSILEGLLLLSRADAGRLQVALEPINLSQVIVTWLEDASFLAEQRNITIQSEIEPGLWIKGDVNMLQQVAHNLFANAVRYNREGGEIDCLLSASDDKIEWRIANTGDQIPHQDQARIFDRFFRSEASLQSEGIGLGLSLVREIVDAHEGKVELEASDEGRTCFRVEFSRHYP